jgi:Dyp-type peroxidase family
MKLNNTKPLSKEDLGSYGKLFEDIQGNILKSHSRNNVRLLFLQFENGAPQVKQWIKQLLPQLTSMAKQMKNTATFKATKGAEEATFMSLSLSYAGYEFLNPNLPKEIFQDNSFVAGMQSGTIPSDPKVEHWQEGYQQALHAVIILAQDNTEALEAKLREVEESMPEQVRIVQRELGKALINDKGFHIEHFGFADGLSQPRFFQEDVENKSTKTDKWNPFAPLNLLLTADKFGTTFKGDTNEPEAATDHKGTHSYGSYLVFRKLEQDVKGWNDQVENIQKNTRLNAELIGAYAVGRFKDGTPVIEQDTPENLDASRPVENNFNFAGDMDGTKCPFHSHIRKTNPRGDIARVFGENDPEKEKQLNEEERNSRIARRAIPYGEQEGENEKGLLFMCYQQSITKQFEVMQKDWANTQGFVKDKTGVDSVIGQNGENQHLKKNWPKKYGKGSNAEDFFQLSFGEFVSMRGGEYFFTPSLSGLKNLVKLS